jgi:hypothetical protein
MPEACSSARVCLQSGDRFESTARVDPQMVDPSDPAPRRFTVLISDIADFR